MNRYLTRVFAISIGLLALSIQSPAQSTTPGADQDQPAAAEPQNPAKPESESHAKVSKKKGSAVPQPEDEHTRPEFRLQNGMTVEDVVSRVVKREREEVAAIGLYAPIVETYMQELKPDKELGLVPRSDSYFIGQMVFGQDDKYESMIAKHRAKDFAKNFQPNGWIFNPAAYAQMVFVDPGGFNKENYQIRYAGEAFLGEVRCFMFDVEPRNKKASWKFTGRIWAEDRDFTIIRINGVYNPQYHLDLFKQTFGEHFDSWRTNVQTGLWLPTYVFTEEVKPNAWKAMQPNSKSQTRFWGYRLKRSLHEEEFANMTIEAATALTQDDAKHDLSPLESQREWRKQSERNVMDVLEQDGLLAPPGDVDKTLTTIINNLIVSSNLEDRVDLHARVLLTGTLEMFTIGDTIVISRGLIDVTPNEATMAAMLAQEIADALVPNPYSDEYAFSDLLRLPPTEALRRLSLSTEKNQSKNQEAEVMDILKVSPYVANLASAGLFLEQLNAQSKALKELVSPRLGNRVTLAHELLSTRPQLRPLDLSQQAALPLGSRIKVDPWTDKIEMVKTSTPPLKSAREKMPFEVTPFIPYEVRVPQQVALLNSTGATSH